MRARHSLAAAACAAALTLPGCGDGDSSSGDETEGADSRQPTERVAIETADGSFNPAQIYEETAPGVVTITAILGGGGGILGGGGAGQGSGFVLDEDGYIATNAHVVTDAETVGGGSIDEAEEVYVQFADRNQVPADVIGFDPFADVALIKVEPDGLDLEPVELGELGDVAVGEPVAAIGSPFGEDQSLSTGIVSATDRSVQSLTNFNIDGAIQTDASINPGNSGGPLIDAEGKVIGINQQINTTSGGNEGVGFAVPVDLAERSLEQLREDGEVEYAYLGVTTQPLYPQLAERLDVSSETGALVAETVQGGPADEAGIEQSDEQIQFQGRRVEAGGDVITAVDGEEIVGASDLPRLISRLAPGDDVTVEIIRDGETEEVDVTLGERPERAG